jgi:hypothetical protein
MNTKIFLGISLAAVFAVTMITPAIAGDDGFLNVTGGGVDNTNPNITKITIISETPIPRNAGDVLGGFAWFTDGADEWPAFAITGHDAGNIDDNAASPPNDVRDSKQIPDGWHLHLVNVDENACITAVSDDTQGGIRVDKDGVMKVTIPTSEIDGTISGPASGFHIVPGVVICDGKHPLSLQVQFT